jgi:hypothetical protein
VVTASMSQTATNRQLKSLLIGWHYLPGNADSEGALPAATFLDLDAAAGMRSAERLCRVYFKGRPEPREIVEKARAWLDQGCRVQLGNEPNLPAEQFGGGPSEYAEWFLDVAARLPLGARLDYAGMSPGMPGWRDWYTHPLARLAVGRASGIAAHAYGTCDQMLELVRFLAGTFPGKPLWLAEVNFGAGQEVNLEAWATAELDPFLDACAAIPEVEAVTYFGYRWQTPDMHLPTPVDGAGTAIEHVLRTWTPPKPQEGPMQPPTNKPALPDLCPFAEYTPLTRNFDREGTAPKIAVWHGTAGLGDPYQWWNRPAAPNQVASADFWIRKDGLLRQYVKLVTQTSWSNGPLLKPDLSVPFLKWLVEYRKKHPGFTGNWWTVSIELEKDPKNADALTAAQVKTGSRLAGWLKSEFAIPLDRTHHLGHYQLDSVNRALCPRLGDAEWAKLLAPSGKTEPQIDALRNQLWVLKDTAWALGRKRLGDDVMDAVRRDKGEIK